MEPEDNNLLVFVTHGPKSPERCATPFYMASVACAMDGKATLVFQIDGVLLMKKGVAEDLRALEGGKLIIDFIREAKEAGVEFYCCSAALQLHNMTEADLIPECNGVVGAAWMMDRAGDANVVLTY